MSKGNVSSWTVVARAGARGLVAAMAMTGVRTVTGNTGLMERSPPEAIVERHAPPPIKRLAAEHRSAVTELAHWSYGAAGGAMFGMLPAPVRAHPLTGTAYGLAVWLSFEVGIAPLLGVQHTQQSSTTGRAVVGLDHALYGIVVSGRLAPEPELFSRTRRRGPTGRGASSDRR